MSRYASVLRARTNLSAAVPRKSPSPLAQLEPDAPEYKEEELDSDGEVEGDTDGPAACACGSKLDENGVCAGCEDELDDANDPLQHDREMPEPRQDVGHGEEGTKKRKRQDDPEDEADQYLPNHQQLRRRLGVIFNGLGIFNERIFPDVHDRVMMRQIWREAIGAIGQIVNSRFQHDESPIDYDECAFVCGRVRPDAVDAVNNFFVAIIQARPAATVVDDLVAAICCPDCAARQEKRAHQLKQLLLAVALRTHMDLTQRTQADVNRIAAAVDYKRSKLADLEESLAVLVELKRGFVAAEEEDGVGLAGFLLRSIKT